MHFKERSATSVFHFSTPPIYFMSLRHLRLTINCARYQDGMRSVCKKLSQLTAKSLCAFCGIYRWYT